MIDMTPPPAVIEFAEKNGYKNIKPNLFWVGTTNSNNFNGYKVYNVDDSEIYFGYILVKDEEIRFATQEEANELSDIFY